MNSKAQHEITSLNKIKKGRRTLWLAHTSFFAFVSIALLGINFFTSGLSHLWAIWPIGLWGMLWGMHSIQAVMAQASDNKKISAYGQIAENDNHEKITLPPELAEIEQSLHGSYKKLEALIGSLKQENPELKDSLDTVQKQSIHVIEKAMSLWELGQEVDLEQLQYQLMQLQQQEKAGDELIHESTAALQEKIERYEHINQQYKSLVLRLGLMHDQIDKIRLDLASQEHEHDLDLQSVIRDLNTEVKTAQELQNLSIQ